MPAIMSVCDTIKKGCGKYMKILICHERFLFRFAD